MRYLIIGAAGFAQEVAWSLASQIRTQGLRRDFLFFDDAVAPGPLASGLGYVAGGLDIVKLHVESARRGGDPLVRLVLGIGLPRVKEAVVTRLAPLAVPWATVIHPAAIVGPNVEIGAGSYVGAGAILTVNARVGSFVTVNLHCQVAHDDVIEDFVTLHPDVHLSGNVAVGRGAELGTGAIVTPGTTVGPGAVLGAGCVAVRSLAGGQTYVGMPARALDDGPAAHAPVPAAAGAERALGGDA
jgi:acetyltransferase EpsM